MSQIFLTLIGMGLVGIFWNSWQWREVWSSRNWVTITGTVLSSTIDYQGGGQWPRPKKKGSFFANIIYRYEVDNRVYTNDRLHFGIGYGTEEQARDEVAHYHEGMELEVICNPQNPRQSVLVPRVCMSHPWSLGLGFLFTSVGCVGIMTVQAPWLPDIPIAFR